MGTKQKKPQISRVTGLTAKQEQVCECLVAGEDLDAVAAKFGISVSTLYIWQKQPTFTCYYNKCRGVRRESAVQSLYGLADEAIRTVRDSMSSENESVRLRAATYIIDKLHSAEFGVTDVKTAVREEVEMPRISCLNINSYLNRLHELGVGTVDDDFSDYKHTLE